jgi:hypothetical protein
MVALFLNNPTILNKVSGKTLVLRETFDIDYPLMFKPYLEDKSRGGSRISS